jgi:hypothetical protein
MQASYLNGGRRAVFLIVAAIAISPGVAEEDLSSKATPVCLLPKLSVKPPAPWYSVPIVDDDKRISGCQMIWEEGDQYMGIMRLVSFDFQDRPDDEANWENFVIGFEALVLESMNFKLGEVLWQRDPVPVSGEGFDGGKAIAIEARLEGVDHTNEAHFMLFEGTSHKYVISVLTPSKAVDQDVYDANTGAMGEVMRTLQPR